MPESIDVRRAFELAQVARQPTAHGLAALEELPDIVTALACMILELAHTSYSEWAVRVTVKATGVVETVASPSKESARRSVQDARRRGDPAAELMRREVGVWRVADPEEAAGS